MEGGRGLSADMYCAQQVEGRQVSQWVGYSCSAVKTFLALLVAWRAGQLPPPGLPPFHLWDIFLLEGHLDKLFQEGMGGTLLAGR